jgi:hypothetical protein
VNKALPEWMNKNNGQLPVKAEKQPMKKGRPMNFLMRKLLKPVKGGGNRDGNQNSEHLSEIGRKGGQH